jgi:hypothetical protein
MFDSEIFSDLANECPLKPKSNKKTKDFGRKFMVSSPITLRKSNNVQCKLILCEAIRTSK